MSLSDTTKAIIKSTVPILRTHGISIIQTFYTDLLHRYPSVRRKFNPDNQSAKHGVPRQVAALANAVILYASRIDDLERLLPQLRGIAERHVSRGVVAEEYDAVGECLLRAMGTVLGEVASEKVIRAWEEAYAVLKDVFVGMEDDVRMENEERAGWTGVKDVVVRERVIKDGGCVLRLGVEVEQCMPGMFVSVVVGEGEEMCMTSLEIIRVYDDGFAVNVVDDGGYTSRELMKVDIADTLSISVPCGMPN